MELSNEELRNFFSYKDTCSNSDRFKLPAVELLKYFIRVKNKTFPIFHKGDHSFVSSSAEDMDDVVEWVYEVRGNPNYSF